MIYQNHDINSNPFFVNKDDSEIVANIHILKNAKLAEQIYYSPSYCPAVHCYNSNDGSCFENYYISYIFNDDGGVITKQIIPSTITLDEYQEALFNNIQTQIQEIYKKYKTVTLLYSGGIDSITLLSFIINLNLLSRTNIVFFENKVTNSVKKNLVYNLFQELNTKIKNIDILNITVDDIAYNFNNGTYENLICYSTSTVIRNKKNQALIGGWFGNSTLLHKGNFIADILASDPEQINRCKEVVSKDYFYARSIKNYNFDKLNPTINHQYLFVKPWLNLSNDTQTYAPLGNNNIFQLLRGLDFSTVDISVLTDATVARTIIHKNVGNTLDKFIEVEDLTDGDVLLPCNIPLNLLDITKLTIPKSLNHNERGLYYINSELDLAYKNQYIPLNSLTVIKALQWIAQC